MFQYFRKMEVFAPYLGSLLNYASYQNISSEALRKHLSKPHLDTSNPEEMVDASEYLSVFEQIMEATGDEYCGLNFGSYLNLAALGLVLEISLNTSNIEQGLLILQNFLDKKFPLVSARIVEDPHQYIVELDSSVEDLNLKRQLLDMVLSIVYRELKLMLPKPFEAQVRLPFSDDKPYNRAFNIEVAYHSSFQIVLPLEIVNTEINKNRVKEIELLLPKFMAMLNKNAEEGKIFTHKVRNMILNMCSPEIPNLEQVQRNFPYSNRTMQRKLTKEGMSFRTIVNAVKEELSNYLMNEKHLKTKDVALILGYSDSSAYLHAVKSWQKK